MSFSAYPAKFIGVLALSNKLLLECTRRSSLFAGREFHADIPPVIK